MTIEIDSITFYLATEREARLVILNADGQAYATPTRDQLDHYARTGEIADLPDDCIGVRFLDERDNDVAVGFLAREVRTYLKSL